MLLYSVYIFDFDGTVADSSLDVWQSIQYACQKCNIILKKKDMEDQEKLSWTSVKLYTYLTGNKNREEGEYFASLIRYHYRCRNRFKNTRLYPGIDMLLRTISENKHCYIASMKTEAVLRKILAEKKWEKYFKEVYGTKDDKIISKTEMIYNILKEERGVPKTQFVYIGDSYTDIIAAKENGIDTIGVSYGDGCAKRLLEQKPDYVIATSNELYRFIVGEKLGF